MSLTMRKPSLDAVQYISDTHGKTTGVIVPIDVWQEMIGERETAYLLSSARMQARLLEAKDRQTGLDVEVVREKLGI